MYAGEQFDFDLNLYYNRARYLDVNRGRFWSQDSFEGHIIKPSTLHKYTYASSDPINKIDPSGFTSIGETVQTQNLMSRLGIGAARATQVVKQNVARTVGKLGKAITDNLSKGVDCVTSELQVGQIAGQAHYKKPEGKELQK